MTAEGNDVPEALRGFLDYEPEPRTGPAPEREVTRLIALPAAEVAALRAKAAAADRVRELADKEDEFCEEMQQAEIRVAVPMKAGQDFLDRVFDVIADAASKAQPEDRDWDVFVSASMPETPEVPVHLIRRALDGDPC